MFRSRLRMLHRMDYYNKYKWFIQLHVCYDCLDSNYLVMRTHSSLQACYWYRYWRVTWYCSTSSGCCASTCFIFTPHRAAKAERGFFLFKKVIWINDKSFLAHAFFLQWEENTILKDHIKFLVLLIRQCCNTADESIVWNRQHEQCRISWFFLVNQKCTGTSVTTFLNKLLF